VRRACIVVILALCSLAHADRAAEPTPSLADARRAIADVRYDDARRLLVEVLARGGSRPEELREIYELSAVTAVVLGQVDLAEQYYRRLLALDPAASLPAGASPRLRDPFVAAQAYMAAHGRLEVRAARRGAAIEVTVVSDPLGMVAAVTAIVDGAPMPKRAFTGQPVVLEATGDVQEVVILDEHGNSLRAFAASELSGSSPGATGVNGRSTPHAPRTPIVRRSMTWAIPATLLAGAGVVFLVDARRAKGRLDDILADDATHFFDEAETERRRWRGSTLVASLSFVAAGAFTATAIVMFATRPTTTLTPIAGGDRVGFALAGTF